MPSKQFAHLRRQSRERLQAIAADAGVSLAVLDGGNHWRVHLDPDADPIFISTRFQATDAFLRGYVAGRTEHTFTNVVARHTLPEPGA